jgi:hypothetical protein
LTRRRAYALACVVALAVLAAGSAYAFQRETRYESTAVVALAPRADVPTEDIPTLVGTFANSGVLGTYVELITSRDTLQAAGSPPVTVQARAVPNTRVIDVTAEGEQAVVRPALVSVLRAAALSQHELRDAWELRVLQAAQPAVEAGPRPEVIVAASAVLAAFGVVLLFVILRQLGLLEQPPTAVARQGLAPAGETDDGAPKNVPRRHQPRRGAR